MRINVISNVIDGVKSSHCIVVFERFVGDNENEKLERKMRISKGLRYRGKLTKKEEEEGRYHMILLYDFSEMISNVNDVNIGMHVIGVVI